MQSNQFDRRALLASAAATGASLLLPQPAAAATPKADAAAIRKALEAGKAETCLLYTSPSPRDS